jgi:hypothetical protein
VAPQDTRPHAPAEVVTNELAPRDTESCVPFATPTTWPKTRAPVRRARKQAKDAVLAVELPLRSCTPRPIRGHHLKAKPQ